MIRFLLSLIVLTLIITYLAIPFVKYIKALFNKEAQRIDKQLTEDILEKKENE